MNPYLDFGTGGDPVAWAALAAALAVFALSFQPAFAAWVKALPARIAIGALMALALLLSVGYIAHYLRGGPRIIDSTYYYLEARAFASGQFAFAAPEPLAAFRGRFLLTTPAGDALGVLFPPGYPAALAVAVLFGAPMALGPLLAAALVAATYWAARELGATSQVARSAALFSALCAALRYHTADTMSHGLAALLVTLVVASAIRASRNMLLFSGLACGWLIATRPVSGVIALLVAVWLARRAQRKAGYLILGLVPGVLLLLAHRHDLTGSWFRSTQSAYYSVADGPPGCFRYGLGRGIGCLFEHGDYVRARLPDGYGAWQALATTLRRLGVHCLDIANAAPLTLGVVFGAWVLRKQPAARATSLMIVGIVLGYAPFYFEGSYPGGGARFFADVLPLEHVLLAVGLGAIGALRFGAPLALLGFALHTHAQHELLAEREGGRPMFESRVLEEQGIDRGLVFVTTDHGFALGHDPSQASAKTGVVVARAHEDALDRLLWQKLGRPQAFVYVFDAGAPVAAPHLTPWLPPERATLRIEAESLWPVLERSAGWAHPDFTPEACASAGRGLRFRTSPNSARAEGGDPNVVDLTLDLPATGAANDVVIGWLSRSDAPVTVGWQDSTGSTRTQPLSWQDRLGSCRRSDAVGPLPERGPRTIRIRAETGLLDYIDLTEPLSKRR